MARKALERNSYYPYHVYNRSIDRAFYPVDPLMMWNLACDLLCILSWSFDAKIHGFVLMTNHYHLLISTPSENLDSCIGYFQSEFSKWMACGTQKQAYSFGTRYRWSIIKTPTYYGNVYRYIYQNPTRAGLSPNAEEYEWSTFRGKLGLAKLKCPLVDHEFNGIFPEVGSHESEWVNTNYSDEEVWKIRRGLRKATFAPPTRLIFTDGKRRASDGRDRATAGSY